MSVATSAAGAPFARADPAEAGADAAVWRVRLLGGFELDDGRHRLTRLRSRAAMALVARLAMAPGRDHAREELTTLLWPDATAEAGRSRLRQTLSLLRAVLEPPGVPPVVEADRRRLRVAPGALWCDVPAFERAARAGRAEAAGALYRGELLPGHYDEWILEERQRLEALHERLRLSAPAVPVPQAAPASASPRAAAPAARATATPGLPAAPATRLPQYLTRLIGADVQAARLRALVVEHRLVTVLGPGGAGKTRLAVEVARWLAEAGQDPRAPVFERAVFVSLVGAVSAPQWLDRLLLAMRLESGGDAVEQFAAAAQDQRLLVVLDNAEQLDDAAVRAIAGLAERLPAVHWLVTSRRPLGLDGEQAFGIDALELPAAGASIAELAMNPAVALFVERARAHRADFHLNAGNATALAALVAWLEGLPLAIELAASRARSAGPAELLALLQAARAQPHPGGGTLAFLARRGTRSGSDPRHASMLAVVEWSWQLLGHDAQELLALMSLAPAGLTAEAAIALRRQADHGLVPTRVLAELDELAAHSVLRLQPGLDGRTRYLPCEPVREYALARQDAAAQRLGRRLLLGWLLDWAGAMPATPALPSVRDELPNVMQALDHAPADGDADRALRLVLVLQSAWGEIALPAGALDSLDRLLAAEGLDDSHAAAGHALAATSCQVAGRADDVRRHVAAALQRPCPDPALRANTLSRVARMRWRVDRDADGTRALIAEALPLARAAGRPNTEAALLSLLSHLASVVDRDHERARELTAQSRALWARSGNRHLVNAGRYNAAVQAVQAGQAAAMLPEFDALEAEGRELQDWDLVAGALEARGTALQKLRRWQESADSLRASLAVAWAGMENLAAVHALWNLPPALVRLRQGEQAALAMGCAETQWRQRFGAMDRGDRRDLARIRRCARVLLGPQAAAAAWQRGAAMSLGQVVRELLPPPSHP